MCDPRNKTPMAAPESVEWPGHGTANRQQPRGMSDYARGAGIFGFANYLTDDGYMLRFRDGIRWQAQYKGWTTKWFESAENAINNLNKRMAQ